ncbi:MAG: winged helix-turn-helix domain-containing protein [Candidatus Nanoarchaeia archaeon]|nr:winged helix-turn-helix domain-containing protein [Candidatus Nanoarchaeia archaeon]
MEEKVTIDMGTLKAIVVETRLNILKLLSEKSYTLTDIANLLEMKPSTVKEHLDILVKAGLIEKEETERKWKYYSLTFKGKMIAKPMEIKIMFMFGVASIASIAAAAYFLKQLMVQKTMMDIGQSALRGIAEKASDTALLVAIPSDEALEAAPMMQNLIEESAPAIVQSASVSPWTQILLSFFILLFLVSISAFLLGLYLKRRTVIINNRK